MLILTRRTGEQLDMTDEEGRRVTLVVLGVIGNQVRFGINARKTLTIDRHEITLRKARENAARDQNGEINGNVADPHEEEAPPPEPRREERASSCRLPTIRLKRRNVDSLEERRQLEGMR